MYLRIRRRRTPARTYAYVDIVESRRVDGKVRHRILGTLGRWDELAPEVLDSLARRLQAWARIKRAGRTAGTVTSSRKA